MTIMEIATGFAILISCFGLFGLSGANMVNRTKDKLGFVRCQYGSRFTCRLNYYELSYPKAIHVNPAETLKYE